MFRNIKYVIISLLAIILMTLISSCGLPYSNLFSKNKYKVQIHDIGHIDFPGGLGRWAMDNDVVQLMIATTYDPDSKECIFVHPDFPNEKKTAQKADWSFTEWSPIISFWRVHGEKKNPYYINEVHEVFEDFKITRNHMIPSEPTKHKSFSYMTAQHRGYVDVSFPEFNLEDKRQIYAKMVAKNLVLNFLLTPVHINGNDCKVKMENWDDDFKTRTEFKPENGIGIDMGASIFSNANYTLKKSSIKDVLNVNEFGINSISFETNKVIPLNSGSVVRTDIQRSLAGDLFKLKGDDIIEIFSKSAAIQSINISLHKANIESFIQQIPKFFGINFGIIKHLFKYASDHTTLRQLLLTGNSYLNQNERKFKSDLKLLLAQVHNIPQLCPVYADYINELTIDEEITISNIAKIESNYKFDINGASYAWGEPNSNIKHEFKVDQFLLHDIEGALLKLANGDKTIFDAKKLVQFYRKYEPEIEEFLSSINIGSISKAEVLQSLLAFMEWSSELGVENQIIIDIKHQSQVNNLLTTMIAGLLTASPTLETLSDIGANISRIVFTPNQIKIYMSSQVEGPIDNNRSRTNLGLFGKRIENDTQKRSFVSFKHNPENNRFDIEGIFVKNNSSLLPVSYLTYDVINKQQQQRPKGKLTLAIDIKEYKRQLLIAPSGDYYFKDVFIHN